MEIKQQYFGLNKSQYVQTLVDAGDKGKAKKQQT
jgi:hypothetical protein